MTIMFLIKIKNYHNVSKQDKNDHTVSNQDKKR